ncbi:uncharacterized protein LOC132736525 isoform X2 [Ruditapes philippinarum]|uniref:uncharacterized protein LOC132736525 isoform X2 n=1 Tax=Ruditapes philippinarum TaxID=129788 RepID=UPI00295ADBB2|nr:uncharacterized protein LOC132736525 isoform X2 [Ruditapes philippinarum]
MRQLTKIMRRLLWICIFISAVTDIVEGQGRLLSPPGRSSLWRFGFGTPVNYNDNALSCGGIQHRAEVNKGKCGVCGDPWESKPRDNEAGGQYAMEIISGVYKSGALLEAIADVANANGGYFEFRLCANNNFSSPVKEECLDKGLLTLEDGITTRYENIHTGLNRVILMLPEGLTCEQCVLQWKYRAADQYGCDNTHPGVEKKCGFGIGDLQTEYFACADIAIYNHTGENINFPAPDQYSYDVQDLSALSQQNSSPAHTISKRSVHIPYERSAGIRYVPAFPSGMQLQFEQNSLHKQPPQSQVQWSWSLKGPGAAVGSGRARRRTHNQQLPTNINVANRHLNGIIPTAQNGAGRVRSSFNQRQNGPSLFNGASLNNIEIPEPAAIETSQTHVRAILRTPMSMQGIPVSSVPKPSFSVKTITNTQQTSRVLSLPKPQYNRKSPFPTQRNFLDPFTQKKVSTQTQMVLSRSNYKPTKQCQHCPFDQCLDDKLRIDNLFPGLFDSPTQFFECKRFERVFTLGNYDVVQEGLPSCQHPRFKRQLKTFEDDEIGCCGTRPQVILPLTVEAENDTFSVVQLGDVKKQFIVQGICGSQPR